MNLTKFVFFENTELVNIQNTIHFENNQIRDDFFERYNKLEFESLFNFRRDRGLLKVPKLYEDLLKFNYGYFTNQKENRRYYFFITDYEYLNDNTTQVTIMPDFVMTFCQGNRLNEIGQVEIIRQHITQNRYNELEQYLRNTDDTLQVKSLKYIKHLSIPMLESYILLTTSVDLEADFGTEKKPILRSSTGGVFDGMKSMLNVYIIPSEKWDSFLTHLSSFPWIAQNIKEACQIPSLLVNLEEQKKVKFKDSEVEFYKLKKGGKSKEIDLGKINIEKGTLLNMLGIDNMPHLLRNGYFTFELTDFSGNIVPLEPSKLYQGLKFRAVSTIGYNNLLKIYPIGYNNELGDKKGTYLNVNLSFIEFNKMSTVVDTAKLEWAKGAYNRELENSKTISGRAQKIMDGNSSVQDKFFNAMSVFSTFKGGIGSVAGAFSDEYDYYRKQKADKQTLALNANQVNDGNYPNSLLLKDSMYGIHLLISAPHKFELDKLKQYYNLYGFDFDEKLEQLEPVNSMNNVNYVQFKGNWYLNEADPQINIVLKTIFENGVKFWHYDGTTNNQINRPILVNNWRG
nr:MAG TPA: Major tail protein [Caudoviricetes sp.]